LKMRLMQRQPILVIKDAGKALVQVIDNGLGMSVTDARLCFERHATSKIRQAEDLFSLHTKGFRGEALLLSLRLRMWR
jgi:DNA mismatch repair protein MutL